MVMIPMMTQAAGLFQHGHEGPAVPAGPTHRDGRGMTPSSCRTASSGASSQTSSRSPSAPTAGTTSWALVALAR